MKNEHLSFLFYCFYCLIFPSICPHINYMATASNGVEYPFFHPTVQLIQRFVLQESRQLRIFLASYHRTFIQKFLQPATTFFHRNFGRMCKSRLRFFYKSTNLLSERRLRTKIYIVEIDGLRMYLFGIHYRTCFQLG